MQNISEYIFEKFKINSKTVSKSKILDKSDVVSKLTELFPVNDSLKDLIEVFEEWVNKYKVKDVIPIAYPVSLEKYQNSKSYKLSEEALDLYQKQNSPDNCDKCEELLDNTDTLYEHPWDDYRIYGSKDIIVFNPNRHTHLDNLYCLSVK